MSDDIYSMTKTGFHEALRQAKEEAWDAGLAKGSDLAAWAIGGRPESERPNTANPYRTAK